MHVMFYVGEKDYNDTDNKFTYRAKNNKQHLIF